MTLNGVAGRGLDDRVLPPRSSPRLAHRRSPTAVEVPVTCQRPLTTLDCHGPSGRMEFLPTTAAKTHLARLTEHLGTFVSQKKLPKVWAAFRERLVSPRPEPKRWRKQKPVTCSGKELLVAGWNRRHRDAPR